MGALVKIRRDVAKAGLEHLKKNGNSATGLLNTMLEQVVPKYVIASEKLLEVDEGDTEYVWLDCTEVKRMLGMG